MNWFWDVTVLCTFDNKALLKQTLVNVSVQFANISFLPFRCRELRHLASSRIKGSSKNKAIQQAKCKRRMEKTPLWMWTLILLKTFWSHSPHSKG